MSIHLYKMEFKNGFRNKSLPNILCNFHRTAVANDYGRSGTSDYVQLNFGNGTSL
jgi:hypothetical protein